MKEFYCPNDTKPGQRARTRGLIVNGGIHRRLLDIGLVEDTEVGRPGKNPFGDPCAYLIRGVVIAIRSKDCRNILIYG